MGVRPPSKRQAARPAPARSAPPAGQRAAEPAARAYDTDIGGKIEDGGPGKNVLVRSKYVREDSGTHEVLKIVDDSLVPEELDDGGIDPYNTGRFDRSKNWNTHYRK